MAYEPVDGGALRCPRHGTTFDPAQGEQCSACDADPEPLPNEAPLPTAPPPDGCLTISEIERRAVEMMDEISSTLRSLRATPAKKPNLGLWNTIAKLHDAWVKAARLAAEFASVRERRAYVRMIEERDRATRKGRKRR